MEYVNWLSFASSFLLVILLLGATLWGLKRFGRMQLQKTADGSGLTLVDSISIGTRQRLVLVEADGQRMLVGVTPQSISGLGQWPATKTPKFAELVDSAKASEEPTDA